MAAWSLVGRLLLGEPSWRDHGTETLGAVAGCRATFQAHGRPAPEDARGKQHFLNFFPLPHGQGSLRPTPLSGLTAGNRGARGSIPATSRAIRRAWSCLATSEKPYQPSSSPVASSSGAILSCLKPAIRSGSASVRPRSSRKRS